MDENVTLDNQCRTEVGPVVLMNKMNVSPDEVEEFLRVFAETTKVSKQQPGFNCTDESLEVLHSLIMWYGNL
jgi:antibiotic biosynthesis monooxygenase (ABM) superfamily enzyme